MTTTRLPEFYWRLPTRGDGRPAQATVRRRGERSPGAPAPFGPGLTDPRGGRFNYFDHLHQITRAAELSGFDGIQIQHDLAGDESWIVAGYLARDTRRLKLVTEFEASWGSPVYAAKNAASLQRYTGGRMGWFLLEGADASERQRLADPVPDEDRVPRIGEFLEVARGVLTRAPYSFKGRFFEVFEGGFQGGLDHQVVPPVFLAGTSPAALALSAERADVHVHPALPAEQLGGVVATLDRLAAERGRTLRHAVQVDLLARETDDEAARDARRFSDQTGQPGPALVGRYIDVAARLSAYRRAGVDTFLLSAVPHLEEAYRIGTYLLPLLREQASRAVASPSTTQGAHHP